MHGFDLSCKSERPLLTICTEIYFFHHKDWTSGRLWMIGHKINFHLYSCNQLPTTQRDKFDVIIIYLYRIEIDEVMIYLCPNIKYTDVFKYL